MTVHVHLVAASSIPFSSLQTARCSYHPPSLAALVENFIFAIRMVLHLLCANSPQGRWPEPAVGEGGSFIYEPKAKREGQCAAITLHSTLQYFCASTAHTMLTSSLLPPPLFSSSSFLCCFLVRVRVQVRPGPCPILKGTWHARTVCVPQSTLRISRRSPPNRPKRINHISSGPRGGDILPAKCSTGACSCLCR